eukprot:gene14629-19355_t
MFLGPVEQSKPWDTKGIEGVHRFLKKLWRLFYDELKGLVVTTDPPTAAELKVLHKTIKKIEEDTERFSFNTAVSGFMIAVNELQDLKCHKAAILEPLIVLLVPYAPHIAEELYKALGNHGSVLDAAYPVFEAKHVVESVKEYPISINGKLRTTMDIALDATQPEVETLVYANETVQKWLEGKPVKKFIFVKGKMVNVRVFNWLECKPALSKLAQLFLQLSRVDIINFLPSQNWHGNAFAFLELATDFHNQSALLEVC